MSNIHNLENQMGQLVSSVLKLEMHMNGKLLSQVLNPKENVSAVMLWSGKELGENKSKQVEIEKEEEIETKLGSKKKSTPSSQTKTMTTTSKVTPHLMNSNFKKKIHCFLWVLIGLRKKTKKKIS